MGNIILFFYRKFKFREIIYWMKLICDFYLYVLRGEFFNLFLYLEF